MPQPIEGMENGIYCLSGIAFETDVCLKTEKGMEAKMKKVNGKKTGICALILALTILGGCGEKAIEEREPLDSRPDVSVLSESSFGDEGNQKAPLFLPDIENIQADGTEAGQEDGRLTLLMAGDMLMHTAVTESGRREDGSYHFDHLFTYTKDIIEAADIAIVNQEVILGGTELGVSGYPSFNAPYELGDALVAAGFDVVLHATNHTLDKGKKGVLNCLNFWEAQYPEIAVLGIQDSALEQEEIYYWEQEGITLAILNYTYGTNGVPLPEDMPYLVNLMDKKKIAADVEKAKEQADFVIVCPHWGTEYIHTASAAQKKWAQFMLACGVDLVMGTHPHVIEPVEMLVREDGHEMLVYYSLGNYVNATSSEGKGVADRMLGALATVTLAQDEEGDVYISEYGTEPIVAYVSADETDITVYPLEMFTDELAESSITFKKDVNFSTAYCRQILEEVLP